MGRLIFVAMHLVAVLFMPLALIVTIPLHLIYAMMSSGRPDTSQHVRCPACQEFAHMDASICPHCRSPLVPYFEQRRRDKAAKAARRA